MTAKSNSDAHQRRTIIAKVRLSAAEAREIDQRAQATGSGKRADYLRSSALQGGGHDALAGMIGQVGLSLNQLEHAPARSIGRISRQLDEIIALLRGKSM
ncbi:hypothetical protein EOW65_16045 [Sinirhodobacter ferrireducens]|uniref:Mobilization protein n=1 Tax=Paenirhodobacter ferrireducens TaxID=1215032 RepID=A0A443L9A8_9RHOB|nr:hypothetical protein [Sinirhodobacter ferrireducens]RWR45747.1 hypothetical protein EOW65_16045 [Sinirhodobacter ferrireducens]